MAEPGAMEAGWPGADKVLTWPTNFPDLNLIKHWWDVLEQVRYIETTD